MDFNETETKYIAQLISDNTEVGETVDSILSKINRKKIYFPLMYYYNIFQDIIENLHEPNRESLLEVLSKFAPDYKEVLEESPESLGGFFELNDKNLEVCLFVNGLDDIFEQSYNNLESYLRANCKFIGV